MRSRSDPGRNIIRSTVFPQHVVTMVHLPCRSGPAFHDLLDDRETAALGDELVDLRVLVVDGDGEARGVAPYGFVLRPGETDVLDAGRVSALALVHVDGGMVPHLAMDVLDPLVAVARQRFVPDLLVSPIVHVLTTSESRYSLEVSSKIHSGNDRACSRGGSPCPRCRAHGVGRPRPQATRRYPWPLSL